MANLARLEKRVGLRPVCDGVPTGADDVQARKELEAAGFRDVVSHNDHWHSAVDPLGRVCAVLRLGAGRWFWFGRDKGQIYGGNAPDNFYFSDPVFDARTFGQYESKLRRSPEQVSGYRGVKVARA